MRLQFKYMYALYNNYNYTLIHMLRYGPVNTYLLSSLAQRVKGSLAKAAVLRAGDPGKEELVGEKRKISCIVLRKNQIT